MKETKRQREAHKNTSIFAVMRLIPASFQPSNLSRTLVLLEERASAPILVTPVKLQEEYKEKVQYYSANFAHLSMSHGSQSLGGITAPLARSASASSPVANRIIPFIVPPPSPPPKGRCFARRAEIGTAAKAPIIIVIRCFSQQAATAYLGLGGPRSRAHMHAA